MGIRGLIRLARRGCASCIAPWHGNLHLAPVPPTLRQWHAGGRVMAQEREQAREQEQEREC